MKSVKSILFAAFALLLTINTTFAQDNRGKVNTDDSKIALLG
jgi:hypothetical protein